MRMLTPGHMPCRLKQPGCMEAVFAGQERLLPRENDLSFFNWNTQSVSSHSSTFFDFF